MDIENIWSVFLEKIEMKVKPVLFQTWFKDTKLINLNNNTATVIVPLDVHKKHLKENYNDIIKETFMEITGSIYNFNYITENEVTEIEKEEIKENDDSLFESGLESKYTFENFVSGESNKFAKAIGLAVAEKPGSMYNPLFIYGSSGLGKTHLMHAIGNYIKDNSNKKVLYVTSEKFVDDFLSIYRKNDNNFKTVDNFKRKYRDIDVLMIDDIQYLEIANKTQQEFFNTFNELHTQNKQIIISSDRSPDDLKKLEDRLRTRFNWGLTIDILPPDFELRLRILDKKIEAQGISSYVPSEVKEYIAANCRSDVRKLEGALTRVFAYATIMNGSEITIELAVEALKDYIGKNILAKNKIDKVIKLVANTYNITPEDIKGKKRLSKIAVPRQIGMYICRIHLKESLPKIGSEFGGKDHTTVMHSVDKISKLIKTNEQLKNDIEKIIAEVK